MTTRSLSIPTIIALFAFATPFFASAHQPRLVEGSPTIVEAPEISKAYYGRLTGAPADFVIRSTVAFPLYVSILVPDVPGAAHDVSVAIVRRDDKMPIALLDGAKGEWKPFFEPFGHDDYLAGAEFRTEAPPGEYVVRVYSPGNDSRYALAIGEKESFDAKEGFSAVLMIPTIKRGFFDKSPIDFVLSPMGAGYLLLMLALGAGVGFLYRAVLRRLARSRVRGAAKNIGTPDRALRYAIAILLLLVAVATDWSPLLLAASGFCFFEAVFSWCGYYAAIGRATCPIE